KEYTMPPITPIIRPIPGPPVNAASNDDTPAVQGTSLTRVSINPLQFGEELGGGVGVIGASGSGVGVQGESTSNLGVGGTSQSGVGVMGQSTSGSGLWAKGTPAGHFEGDVTVTGTVTVDRDIVLANADCAEEFDVASPVGAEPGTVMVIGDDEALHPSSEPYDRRVAGVVSGGGDYKPALLLDRRASSRLRSPVALVGKVCCKVDAEHEPVRV